MLVGCSDGDNTSLAEGAFQAPRETETAIIGANEVPPTPAEVACAGAPKAVTLADVEGAHDVHIVGDKVFFQAGNSVFRVMKDGTNKQEIFKSENLVQSYVDDTSLITIEATANAPDATIHVLDVNAPVAAEGADGPAIATTATATNFNAAGTQVFASDQTSFYLLADTAAGDTIVKVSKDNPATQTVIVASTNVISNPQLVNDVVWYVRDQQRIFKVALADPETGAQGDPVEVFGISYATCNLAVNESAAFCSVGSAVERRDLTGAHPTTILDETKSKTSARFGLSVTNEGTLFVRSEAPDAKVQHVIRALKLEGDGAEERFLACGRSNVTDLAVDATTVVWSEEGKGVFAAPR
jgi:hypothetical protein